MLFGGYLYPSHNTFQVTLCNKNLTILNFFSVRRESVCSRQLSPPTQWTVDSDFFNQCPKISEQAYAELDKDITLEELKATLKTCKDSTPGLDGIPYSFYKTFKNELLPLV